MPSTPKLQDHLFSPHFPCGQENHQKAWDRPARRNQGFISILTLRSKHSVRPGYSAATGSIIACALCWAENYTLMMDFHASVPRKQQGSKGSSTGERVRHVSIGERSIVGRESLSLFTELSNFSVIQKLNFKILIIQSLLVWVSG